MAANSVKIPDGWVVEQPGQQPSAQATQQPLPPIPDGWVVEQPDVSTGEDMAKSFGVGIPQAAIGALGLPGDVSGGVKWTVDQLQKAILGEDSLNNSLAQEQKFKEHIKARGLPDLSLPTSDEITKGVEKVTGKFYEPKTTAGRYVNTATQFAVPTGVAKKAEVATGAVAGLASEGAADLLKFLEQGDYENVGRFLSPILTTILIKKGGKIKNTANGMVSEALDGVTAKQFDEAQALMTSADEMGVPVTGAEALKHQPLLDLQGHTQASTGGNPVMTAALKSRPEKIINAASQQLDTLGPRQNPRRIQGQVEEAANRIIGNAEGARTSATKALYEAASEIDVPESEIKDIIGKIDSIKSAKTTRETLKSLRSELIDEAGQIQTNIGVLDDVRKTFRDQSKFSEINPKAITKATKAKLTPLLQDLKVVLVRNSENFKKGNELYQAMSPDVEALINGDVGALRSSKTLSTTLNVLTDPKTARPENIKILAKQLNEVDEGLFKRLVSVHLENAFDAAAKDIQAGKNPRVGANVRNAVMGTGLKKQNFYAMIEAIEDAEGMPKGDLKKGWVKFMNIAFASGQSQPLGSPTASRALANKTASQGSMTGAVGDMANIADGSVLGWLGRWRRDFIQRKNYRQISEMLTDKDSIEKLRELSKVDVSTNKGKIYVAEMIGFNSSRERPTQK